MPPRTQPKVFILLLKTHKLTVLITAPSTSTVDDIKVEALDALTSGVLATPNPHGEYAMEEDPSDWEVPKVSSKDDFELAKAVKEKQRPTGRYESLDTKAQLKSVLASWDPVFIQFKDANGGLLPVKVSLPVVNDEEPEPTPSAASKGKRKAD
ncbi:hypothetical protein L226DRAFT_529249 [Lentinus tigrinus ALCF2SS1-7]|uniref:Uncharacterized protein n=1 Tax=Lentinus tigrinus ALCF2SS1-6 TaxID=1328759 RepID=A0A5C2SU68_9APHY|nr:hypothetical protein L227DRAFT_569053 [Lentinus tigrinus ALCF2SS1-6]RPD80787.1 hypothetical protein L226DRAFT_529249 [Lentinus tigrinus ALCF2SS1-7]